MTQDARKERLLASESPVSYVKEILEREAETREPAAQPRRRVQGPLLLVLLSVAATLTVWNVMAMTGGGVDSLNAAEEEASARFTVYLIAQTLETHRDSTGTFPPTLETLNVNEEGVRYTSTGNAYELTAKFAEGQIVYRSGEDLSAFARAFEQLARKRAQ
jgi:hypothetical protein